MFDKLRQMLRVLKNSDFMKNPNAPQISVVDRKALLVGLINSEQLVAYCDSLTTGLPRGRVLQGLSEAWDVHDADEALSTLDWVLNEGHRAIYNQVIPLLEIGDKKEREEALITLFNEHYQQEVKRNDNMEEVEAVKGKFEHMMRLGLGFVENLTACMRSYGNDTFVAFNNENIYKGILAWDMGRLVAVSRLAFDAGYIDEQTAWDYIRKGYQAAIQEYTVWKDMATAYLIGRGAWSGDSVMLGGLYVVAKNSVEDDKSPWKSIALK